MQFFSVCLHQFTNNSHSVANKYSNIFHAQYILYSRSPWNYIPFSVSYRNQRRKYSGFNRRVTTFYTQ